MDRDLILRSVGDGFPRQDLIKQLAEAKAQAVRAAELEQALTECWAELDSARREAKDKTVEAGTLTGEAEVLRAQVRELMEVLKPAGGRGRG